VCSAQYGCFLQFLHFMFSRYVAHVFLYDSETAPVAPIIACIINNNNNNIIIIIIIIIII